MNTGICRQAISLPAVLAMLLTPAIGALAAPDLPTNCLASIDFQSTGIIRGFRYQIQVTAWNQQHQPLVGANVLLELVDNSPIPQVVKTATDTTGSGGVAMINMTFDVPAGTYGLVAEVNHGDCYAQSGWFSVSADSGGGGTGHRVPAVTGWGLIAFIAIVLGTGAWFARARIASSGRQRAG